MNKVNYQLVSFYKFTPLEDPGLLSDQLFVLCRRCSVLGTIIISKEGVNGMLAGSQDSIEIVTNFFQKLDFALEDFKFSTSVSKPFNRLRIKIKKELISLGYPELSNPNEVVGTYVEPKDWNDLIAEENLILIDTRNKYETSIGTFHNAILPQVRNFKEFPGFINKYKVKKDTKIAMFCTGGIRCEKASAYLLKTGFKEVFHLKGGIIKYLETVPRKDSKWIGECFVFDNRVSIEHDLKEGSYLNCNGCGEPLRKDETSNPKYKKGISCPKCHGGLSKEKFERSKERQKQVELSAKRGEIHIGQ